MEIEKQRKSKNSKNHEVFNWHTIRSRHWRLLTRIDSEQEAQQLDINSPRVPEAFRLLIQHPTVINARMTCKAVMDDDRDKAIEIVQKNNHHTEELNRRDNTVKFKEVDNFFKELFEYQPMQLDKDRNFNT